MFDKFYEFLYLKVLINIVTSKSKTIVYTEMLNKQGVVESYEKEFDTNYLNPEMREYIHKLSKESPYYYISLLDSSLSQGAIPSTSKHTMGMFHDLSASEYKSFDDKWTFYTAKTDLYAIEKVYEKIGLDFIISPFVVLANFFKDKINSNVAMFVMVEEGTLALSIFKNSQLLYADYIDLKVEMEFDSLEIDDHDIEEISLEEEDGIDLDDLDTLDEIDDLDDFGDIADLDSIDELEDFDETKDVEEELAVQEEQDYDDFPAENTDGLNEDYQRFSLIQSSVNIFYQDERFESEFIENVYIADGVGVSGDLKKYLEEEMFLNVYVRRAELASELCEIAKMELS